MGDSERFPLKPFKTVTHVFYFASKKLEDHMCIRKNCTTLGKLHMSGKRKGKKIRVFLDFLGKVNALAEIKHTIYFEWPNVDNKQE